MEITNPNITTYKPFRKTLIELNSCPYIYKKKLNYTKVIKILKK